MVSTYKNTSLSFSTRSSQLLTHTIILKISTLARGLLKKDEKIFIANSEGLVFLDFR